VVQKFTTAPLSHAEQRLYFYLESEGKSEFTVSELRASSLGFSDHFLHVLLSRLEKKGWLVSVGKGVYLRLPASSAVDGRAYLEDPSEVALKLFPKNAYLAFMSALRVHNLTEYEPFTIFLATRSISRSIRLLEQYEIKAVKYGKRFAGYETRGGYVVSTVPKTFFDCFYHPQYAGGYSEVLKALHACNDPGWQEFRSYLERFASSSLCQKVGYLLQLAQRTEVEVPRDLMEYLASRVRTKTKLDHTVPRRGKWIRTWKVVDNIGEERLLEWWYRG